VPFILAGLGAVHQSIIVLPFDPLIHGRTRQRLFFEETRSSILSYPIVTSIRVLSNNITAAWRLFLELVYLRQNFIYHYF
jgi:hypothetical protein